MRQRLTAGVAGLLVIALAVTLNFYQLPVVAYLPGRTEEVLGRVKVAGRPSTYDSKGQFLLTSIGVDDRIGFYEALLDFADREVSVRPREALYPEGETSEEVNLENATLMDESKLTASIVALRLLGYKVSTTPTGTRVGGILPGGASEGKLRTDDQIVAVDGRQVSSTRQAVEAIRRHRPGDRVHLRVQRQGSMVPVTIVTRPDRSDPALPRIGVTLRDHYDLPVDVTIDTENISGPSAGLIFALSIIDKLTPEDLTGGRKVAGTGTIDTSGKVGPIGGITQKLVGARRVGASVFLVPDGNCAEAARAAPEGLQLVRVDRVQDALAFLRKPPGSTGPAC